MQLLNKSYIPLFLFCIDFFIVCVLHFKNKTKISEIQEMRLVFDEWLFFGDKSCFYVDKICLLQSQKTVIFKVY